jgi:hypothetical protein
MLKRVAGLLFKAGQRCDSAHDPVIDPDPDFSIQRKEKIEPGSEFNESHLMSLLDKFPILCIAFYPAGHIAGNLTHQQGSFGRNDPNGIPFIKG